MLPEKNTSVVTSLWGELFAVDKKHPDPSPIFGILNYIQANLPLSLAGDKKPCFTATFRDMSAALRLSNRTIRAGLDYLSRKENQYIIVRYSKSGGTKITYVR